MALLNDLNLEGFSIPGAYWRVGSLEWNSNEAGLIKVRLDGYTSKDNYLSGSSAVRSVYFEIKLDSEEKLSIFNQVRAICYAEVKKHDDFKNSTDA